MGVGGGGRYLWFQFLSNGAHSRKVATKGVSDLFEIVLGFFCA